MKKIFILFLVLFSVKVQAQYLNANRISGKIPISNLDTTILTSKNAFNGLKASVVGKLDVSNLVNTLQDSSGNKIFPTATIKLLSQQNKDFAKATISNATDLVKRQANARIDSTRQVVSVIGNNLTAEQTARINGLAAKLDLTSLINTLQDSSGNKTFTTATMKSLLKQNQDLANSNARLIAAKTTSDTLKNLTLFADSSALLALIGRHFTAKTTDTVPANPTNVYVQANKLTGVFMSTTEYGFPNTNTRAGNGVDGDVNSRFQSQDGNNTAYLGYDYTNPTLIKTVAIYPAADGVNYGYCIIQASNDNVTWVDIRTVGTLTAGQYNVFRLNSPTSYRYYRIRSNSNTFFIIAEVAFFTK